MRYRPQVPDVPRSWLVRPVLVPVVLLAAALTSLAGAGAGLPPLLAAEVTAQTAPHSAAPAWSVVARFAFSPFSLASVSCPSPSACEAVGANATTSVGDALRSTNGGKRWANKQLPATGSLGAVACPSTSVCEAVGGTYAGFAAVALRSTDGGESWTAQKPPPGTGFFDALACPAASICEAVGETSSGIAGSAMRTVNGGQTWVVQALPPKVGGLAAVACPSPTRVRGRRHGDAALRRRGSAYH